MSAAAAWGELRSLLHGDYPSFIKVLGCVLALQGDEREAALHMIARRAPCYAAGLLDGLEEVPEAALDAWLEKVTLWQVWRHPEEFEAEDEVLELFLADHALREHVRSGVVEAEALQKRQRELASYRTRFGDGALSYWVRELTQAMLEVEVRQAVRQVHHQIALWESAAQTGGAIRDEFQNGFNMLREEARPSALPRLLGGGLGLAQQLGRGMALVQRMTGAMERVTHRTERSREEILSELEEHLARELLGWAARG